jgi:hypothetical protein
MNLQFKKDLTKLLNIYSIDAQCNMPDDVLADYLISMLQSLATVSQREVFETRAVEIHVDGVKDAN